MIYAFSCPAYLVTPYDLVTLFWMTKCVTKWDCTVLISLTYSVFDIWYYWYFSMLIFWSKVFLKTILFFSSISFDNAAQDMRIKGGEIVADLGWFFILMNFIIKLNLHQYVHILFFRKVEFYCFNSWTQMDFTVQVYMWWLNYHK